MVKRRDLLKELGKYGVLLIDHGGRHAKLINPRNNRKAPLPRHREIDDFTAKQIWKQLDLLQRKDDYK